MPSLSEILIQDSKKISAAINFNCLSGKTILITGVSGMVGTYLLASLIDGLDILNDDTRVILVVHNDLPDYLKDLISVHEKLISIYKGDLSDYDFCQSLPLADYIIHSSGYAQPQVFLASQEKTLKINTLATFCLLDKLKAGGHFVFMSSSEIYNGLPAGKYKEVEIGNTSTSHPRACYVEGKRSGEAMCIIKRASGVDARIVRLSSTFGPGTKSGDKRVMQTFIENGLSGDIKLLDSGAAVRNYCYITDAVAMIWNILFWGKEPVYNVGGVAKISIADLARQIGRELDSNVIVPENSQTAIIGAPVDMSLDMDLYEAEFGKINYVNFINGLRSTIEWVKALNNK